MPKRNIEQIVVHCTATKEGQDFSAAEIEVWHKKRGFRKIGYHYVVRLDGSVEKGRHEDEIGAHVEGHNSKTLGVVYVGGLSKSLAPKDTRTDAQKKALLELLTSLKKKYPNAIICGHRDFSPDKNKNGIIEPFEFIKQCPCFDAKKEYKNV